MPVWKLQVAAGGDTAFARDKVVITPHFNDGGVGSDPQQLCTDLCTATAAYYNLQPRQVEVTAYDAEGTVPVAPQGYAIANTGLFPEASSPREVAVCLSFFSTFNRPRWRGRLYMPYFCIQPSGTLAARPNVNHRQKVADYAQILQDLGGPDVDWCVYSRVDGEPRTITNWWVDDEWDTIRSRGLRPTTRTAGTTSEA